MVNKQQPLVNSRLVETRKCQAQLRDELFLITTMILSPFREYEPFAGRLLTPHSSFFRVLVVSLEHVDAFWP